uniref:C2H2-type domain-containing protein n=1 Tax=Bracon brevicornis TaxID=1563983 RepID=A0A6V7LUK5_9HYME
MESVATSIKTEPDSPLNGQTTSNDRMEPSTSNKTPSSDERHSKPPPTARSSQHIDSNTTTRSIITDSPVTRFRNKSSASSTQVNMCDICHLNFANAAQLKVHQVRMKNFKHQCHQCKRCFKTPEAMLEHRTTVHKVYTDRYCCKLCPYKFSRRTSLQAHVGHVHNILLRPPPWGLRNTRPGSLNDTTRSVLQPRRQKTVDNNIQSSPNGTKESMIFRKSRALDNSARNERKRRRDENRQRNELTPGPQLLDNSATQRSDTPNTAPPLVQIHAIPQEVEALLSDHENATPTRLAWKGSNSDSRGGGSRRDTDRPELSTPPKLPSKSSSSVLTRQEPVMRGNWAVLKQKFNCRDCYVNLEKIDLKTIEKEDERFEEVDDDPGRSIGVQLKNLEIALKKLEVPEAFHSEGSVRSSFRVKNKLYKSSVCRTRFTSKQKLVNHYLCFHTSSIQDACGVCRTKCGTSKALKRHLLLHCIEINRSKMDRSPVDPRGPCERYRKKFTCPGCNKRFWLLSCLKQHKELCRNIENEKRPDVHDVGLTGVVEIDRSTPMEVDLVSSDVDASNPETSSEAPESESALQSSCEQLSDRWWEHNAMRKLPWGDFPCSICKANFKNKSNLMEHIKKFSSRKPTRCTICGTLFPSAPLYWHHVERTHNPKRQPYDIRCLVCDQGFKEKRTMRSHLLHVHYDQINKNIKEWKAVRSGYQMECRICKMVFHDRKRFVEHCVYYNDDEYYNCAICQKKFLGRFRCHNHWKTVHYSQELQRAYTHHCKICNEGFMYKTHLLSHLAHIHNETDSDTWRPFFKTPFICTVCEERFETIIQLREHQNAHSNDGKYECDKCDRKCRSELILRKHLKASHSDGNEIPQGKCPTCGEGLVSKSSWISHIKHIHGTLDENHPSEFCLENFSTIKDLVEENSQVQVENNLINCTDETEKLNIRVEDAVASINQTDELKELNIVDNKAANIEYTCAICDNKFMSMNELKEHKTIHNSQDYNFGCLEETNNTTQQILAPTQVNQGRIDVSLKVSSGLPGSMEMSHVSFVSPQKPDSSFCTYYAPKDMPCNLSITNIYSVNLEEYERLNSQLQDERLNNQLQNERLNNQFQQSHQQCKNPKPVEVPVAPTDDINHSNNNNQCEICGTRFPCSNTLQNHLTRYSNIGDYSCDVCGRRFGGPNQLYAHILKHKYRRTEMIPPNYCKKCDETFSSKTLKLMHLAHIHNEHIEPIDKNDLPVTDQQQSSQGNLPASQPSLEKQIEEVDLTEDKDEGVSEAVSKTNPVSPTVKPTPAIQPRVQATQTYRSPINATSSVCSIICNICHMTLNSLDSLIKHFGTDHGIQLSLYQGNTNANESTAITNTNTSQQKTTTNHGNNQESRKSNKTYQLNKIANEVTPGGGGGTAMFYYCKNCKIQFANEYSLLTHLRNAHDKNEMAKQEKPSDNSNNSGNEKSLTVNVETSFVGNDKRPADETDAFKKRQSVVLSKIELPHDPNRPYHILRGTDADGNIAYIRVPKNQLANLKLLKTTMVSKGTGNSSSN